MIALRLLTLVLLFPACEQEMDAASDAGAAPRVTHLFSP